MTEEPNMTTTHDDNICSSNPPEQLVRKKHEKKTREVEEKPETNHDEMLDQLINNPDKLSSLLNQMNGEGGQMSDIIRDVASNPEAAEAVQSMMGNTDMKEKVRNAMAKKGKQPKRKEVLRKQKEMKKALNSNKPVKEEVTCLLITPSRKIKIIKSDKDNILGGHLRLESMDTFQLGDIIVIYDKASKLKNKLVFRMFGYDLGSTVLVYRKGEDGPIDLDESYLRKVIGNNKD